jgi:mediator of RNA polymerase II transcription subunit 16
MGNIAQITSDGSKLNFRSLVRDKRSRGWKLSKKSQHVVDAPAGRRFVHIQFNRMGSDLAVIDDSGLVHLYASLNMLGLVGVDPSFDNDSQTGLGAIMGLHWLPTPIDLKV